MNVLNDEAVAAYCEAVAARAAGDALRDWCRRNLARHVLRSPEFHEAVDPAALEALRAAGELQEVPRWAEAAARRGDTLALFRPEGAAATALARDAWRVVDHRNAVPAPMARASVPEAVAAAEAWEREEAARRLEAFARERGMAPRQATALLSRSDPGVGRLWPEAPGDSREIAVLPDGHRLVEASTRAALEREGTLMDHCVATYWESVESGEARILSLRDPANLPLATLEVSVLDAGPRGVPRAVAEHLPAGLQVAWQVRGISNARPGREATRRLSALLDLASVAVSGTEARWLGLESRHSVEGHVDLAGLAGSMPALAARGPGPGFRAAVELLIDRLPDLTEGQCACLARSLGPRADAAPETEWVSRDPEARRLTWRVPNLLLTSRLAPLLARAPEAVRSAYLPLATAIVEAAEASPEAIHAVAPELGHWPSERPFLAWCGLDGRWSAAQARSAEVRRGRLRERQAECRRRLRQAGLGEEERRRLLNAVNVAIPRLLAAP